MATAPAPIETHAETTAPIWFLDSLVEVRASRERLPVSALEITVPAGDASPLHLQDEDERVYVLAGAATFYVGEEAVDVRAGDSVFIPRGRLHAHLASDLGARWLVVTESGRLEQFIRSAGRPAPAPVLPPARRPSDEEAERVVRVASAHGIEYHGRSGMRTTDL